MGKRGFKHGSAGAAQFIQRLVHRGIAEQHEQRGMTGLKLGCQFLHERIIDADIGQRAGNGPRSRSDRGAEQRVKEDKTDQRPPEPAADGASCGKVNQLVQLDLPVFLLDRNGGVFQLQQVFLLQLEQMQTYFLRFIQRGIRDNNGGAASVSPCSTEGEHFISEML